MARFHREVAEILREHLGPKPRLPAAIAAALGDLNQLVADRDGNSHLSSASTGGESVAHMRAMLESTMDCMVLVGAGGQILAHNHRFAELWNIPEELLEVGKFEKVQQNILFELRHPETFQRYVNELEGDETTERRDVLEFSDGRYFELNTRPQDVPGGGTARVWSFRDVSQIKKAEAAFRHDAFHDALTGLPNRALFADRLGQALAHAERTHTKLAVMFLDLDKFKSVNDTLGHGAGDELLKSVSNRLVGRVRAQDTLSRLAGDEFMILITNLETDEGATHVAQSVLDTMRMPFRIEEQALNVGASIGISLFPKDGLSAEELMKNADVALYQAKEEGRNRFRLFEAGMNNPSTDKMVFENDLRSAVAQNELVVHYQPIVDLRTGDIESVEALVRWKRPGGPLIPPARFIPVAESTGLIGPISEWVLRTAGSASRPWAARNGAQLQVSVNFSAQQFWDPNLVDKIQEQVELAEMDPSALILEITESTIMQDPSKGLNALEKLRDLGVAVALDDFGTGHSSLSFLRHMPITTLKIDRSFVDQCDAEKRDGAIVAAIIRMAKSLDLRVIAEGVERESQARFVKKHGCDAIQGFWFSRPVPREELEAMLRKRAGGAASEPTKVRETAGPSPAVGAS